LTATADAPTRKDIVKLLGLTEGRSFVAGFDRPNIHYSVMEKQSAKQQLVEFLKSHAAESGIVYCLSRKSADETAAFLVEQGVEALPYHAGMDAASRAKNQERFLREESMIVVATIAFGMGIDKPDVRFVVHMNLPKSIEAYYQETGRAGRDGLPSDVLMLYGMSDVASLRNFITESNAPEAQKRIEGHKLNTLLGYCETTRCRRQVLLEYFGDTCEPCGNCDTCQQPQEVFDATIAAQKAISCVLRTDQRFGVVYLIDVLLGKENDRVCQFGHDQVSTFGIGEEFNKQEWRSIFRQLVAFNLLMVDMAGHGGLKVTAEGWQFLREKRTLELRRYTGKAKTARKARQPAVDLPEEDLALFTQLKVKRTELAKAQNVPPYVIFHDKTLREMAALKPHDREGMGSISGVGESKLERY
ncbi:MAG: RecQ family ATP-dependent DNA helicase, partial [Rickettsiales bacterium]